MQHGMNGDVNLVRAPMVIANRCLKDRKPAAVTALPAQAQQDVANQLNLIDYEVIKTGN